MELSMTSRVTLFPCHIQIKVMNTLPSLPPANEVCEGYVFTLVCQSFCSRGVFTSVHAGIHFPLGRHPLRSRYPPPGADPPFAVHAGRYGNKRAVHILLECILVVSLISGL